MVSLSFISRLKSYSNVYKANVELNLVQIDGFLNPGQLLLVSKALKICETPLH